MIRKPDCQKQYASAKGRFLKPILVRFFRRELPKIFGPVLSDRIADAIISIFEEFSPSKDRLQPGQVLWSAIDKTTRPDALNRKYKAVVLSLVTEEDTTQLANGVKPSVIASKAVARMYRESYEQGAVLSNRDLSLLLLRSTAAVTILRQRYEKQNDCVLPHSGVIFDMGPCISHKNTIIKKVIMEKKDPSIVAKETNHSQRSVDRYLNDYHRIKTVYEFNQDLSYIHYVTGIAKNVVKQYITTLKNENTISTI